MTFVSANYTSEDVHAGRVDNIDIFRDQLDGWLLSQAVRLRDDERASVAILNLVTPYFEAIASYLKGKESGGKSGRFLRFGLREVFPGTNKNVLDAFADEIRNGLFHEATIRKVALHHGQEFPGLGFAPIGGRQRLVVDPWFLLDSVRVHLARYVERLRDQPREAALLNKFEKFMTIRWGRWNEGITTTRTCRVRATVKRFLAFCGGVLRRYIRGSGRSGTAS